MSSSPVAQHRPAWLRPKNFLAFAILWADIFLQWQELRRSRPVAAKSKIQPARVQAALAAGD